MAAPRGQGYKNETLMWTPVRLALDELAATIADAQESPANRLILIEVVRDLENAAAAPLGSTHSDPEVVLLRRFARAHRLLLAGDDRLDVTRVRAHTVALRGPEPPARRTTTARSAAMIGT